MRPKAEGVQLLVRLPLDQKRWVESEAARNRSTQTSEIVRALRERMEREKERATA